jgi:hypothetical protein
MGKLGFTKPLKPASRRKKQSVTGCLEKAPEEAEQEDVHVPKNPRGSSKRKKPSVTGCLEKAPEEAEQEDVHVQTAGTLPLTKPGFTTKTVELQQKKIDKTSMLDVLVFTDTHITGLQDEIDDVPLEEWVEKCKAEQQATKNDKDAEIDEVAPDEWVEQFMANDP